MSRKSFVGKTAFVTGGASGIGLEIVQQLLERGANVVSADLNETKLAELEDRLGENFLGIVTDVVDEESVIHAVESTVEKFGRLHFAFNVAGAQKTGNIDILSEEDWNFTVDICLKGVFLGMKHEVRKIREHGEGGAIVNIASLNAHVPMHGGGAYSAAKAGVESLTKTGALEFAEHGIRVNAILPGLVNTPLSKPVIEDPEIFSSYKERIPLKRPAEPIDIAEPAIFLASDEAKYITGVSLLVDGGWGVSGYPDVRKWFSAGREFKTS